MAKWKWLIQHYLKKLWIRSTLLGVLGIVIAIVATFVERYIPWEMPIEVSHEAVSSILTIIASTMLAVSTFSLSVMIAAYSSVSSSATPRATRLLIEDTSSQNMLSAFIGSFMFSIVGLVILKTGVYGERGRVILFAFTICVIVVIVVSLLRWINHLTNIGRLGETTTRVETVARNALEKRISTPFLGGSPLFKGQDAIPEEAIDIKSFQSGYVQYVDMNKLSHIAEKANATVYLISLPGVFLQPDDLIGHVVWNKEKMTEDDLRTHMCKAITIGDERDFDQDPRFGLTVLSEIGSRALSVGINDSATAIGIIDRLGKLVYMWATRPQIHDNLKVDYPNVFVCPLDSDDLFEDAFMQITRDGAALVEVQERLIKVLTMLSRNGDEHSRAAAKKHIKLALKRSELAMNLPDDKERLHSIVNSAQLN